MKVTAIVHRAKEGGYWAEVPAIPGCATQGETLKELRKNLREAVEGCLVNKHGIGRYLIVSDRSECQHAGDQICDG